MYNLFFQILINYYQILLRQFCLFRYLNHIYFRNYNIRLIEAANFVAEKNNMKYYVKFHPSLDLSSYDDYLDQRYAIKVPIETTVAEYSKMVDFSILSHSTVYVELIFFKSKVYLMHVDNLCKFTRFPEYDFSSKEELNELLAKIEEMDNYTIEHFRVAFGNRIVKHMGKFVPVYVVNKLFDYYCFTANPQQEYTNFFEKYYKKTTQ